MEAHDPYAGIAMIITALGTLLIAVGQVINIWYTRRLEKNTNSMKDQLVAEVRQASFREGQKDQKDNPQ